MDGKKSYMVLIFIQLIYTKMYVISKAAFDNGLSSYVFIFYQQVAASMLLVPLAIIFGRKSAPPLSFLVLLKIFMHALLGITLSLNIDNIGLIYTSATVASATTNSAPVITFFLAVLLRVLGRVLLVAGFYTVLQEKSKKNVVCEPMNEDEKDSVEERGATLPCHPV